MLVEGLVNRICDENDLSARSEFLAWSTLTSNSATLPPGAAPPPPDMKATAVEHLPAEDQLLATQIRAQRAELAVKIVRDGPQPPLAHRIEASGEGQGKTTWHEYKIDGAWKRLSSAEVGLKGYRRNGEPLSVKALQSRATQGPGGAAARTKQRRAAQQKRGAEGLRLEALERREKLVDTQESRQERRREWQGESDLEALNAAGSDPNAIPDPIIRKEVRRAADAFAAGPALVLAAI
jgi:hypothetical protein